MRTGILFLTLIAPMAVLACGGRLGELPAGDMASGDESSVDAALPQSDAPPVDTHDAFAADVLGDALGDASEVTDTLIATDAEDAGDADDGADEYTMPACPPAAAIRVGTRCSVAPGLICPWATNNVDCLGKAIVGVCACATSGWSCRPVGLPCRDTCPRATDVSAGASCAGIRPGLVCAGNPTVCNGTTFYDAVRCDAPAWVTIASTTCGIDGGSD